MTTPTPTSGPAPTPGATPPAAPPAGPRATFFSPTSIWNAPLPATAALDPNSAAVMNTLLGQEAVSVSRKSASIATNSSGVPIYVVAANQPDLLVHLDQQAGPTQTDLQRVFDSVPVPPNALPAPGSDANLAVYQPSSDLMWEFNHMAKEADGWHADWGGRLYGVSTSPGYYQNMFDSAGDVLERPWWGTTAASFPLVAGVMTIAELQSGVIPHALGLAISDTCKGVWAAPAQRTDGDVPGPNCVPEGAHFRLDPSLNLAALHLPRVTLMMAQAAQRYGIVINNRSHGFTFRAEDPQQFEAQHGYSPYYGPKGEPGTPGALFDQWSLALVQAFPWSHLQLLKLGLRTKPDMTPVIEP